MDININIIIISSSAPETKKAKKGEDTRTREDEAKEGKGQKRKRNSLHEEIITKTHTIQKQHVSRIQSNSHRQRDTLSLATTQIGPITVPELIFNTPCACDFKRTLDITRGVAFPPCFGLLRAPA
jgi:hypothetical protein